MRKYLIAIGAWLLPPLAVFALPTEAPGLTCLAVIYLYLAGLCLGVAFFTVFFFTPKKPQVAGAFFLVVIIWLLAWQHGFVFGARLHLFVNERRYAKTIDELSRAESQEERDRICEEKCFYSEGRIVVFHYCHCFLSWPDLVYDPTGKLDAPRSELQKINGYLYGSRRLSKNWYIGYFGD
jgi:hypothetical protein